MTYDHFSKIKITFIIVTKHKINGLYQRDMSSIIQYLYVCQYCNSEI